MSQCNITGPDLPVPSIPSILPVPPNSDGGHAPPLTLNFTVLVQSIAESSRIYQKTVGESAVVMRVSSFRAVMSGIEKQKGAIDVNYDAQRRAAIMNLVGGAFQTATGSLATAGKVGYAAKVDRIDRGLSVSRHLERISAVAHAADPLTSFGSSTSMVLQSGGTMETRDDIANAEKTQKDGEAAVQIAGLDAQLASELRARTSEILRFMGTAVEELGRANAAMLSATQVGR